jgi:hypothetical protein
MYYRMTTGWTFNYNNWYGGSVSSGFRGANDVYASPALAQPGALTPDGYRIQSASPDAKSGTSLSAGISDFFGNARRVPYSIGANQNNGS